MRGLVLPIVALVAGCQSDGFQCEGDSECIVQGVAGLCEDNGVCSFPDEECISGRRYGQQAPAELAGVCVEGGGGSSSGTTSTQGTSSVPASTTTAETTSTETSTGVGDSSSSSESSSSTGEPPDPQANIVFMTSLGVPKGPNVVEQADVLCNGLARDAGLPGEYVAWLSTSKVAALDRLLGARGWVRPDGLPFADRPSDILEGRIFYPPVLDELGAEVRSRRALTGTSAAGEVSANCEDWTITEKVSATIGEPGATFSAWTSDGSLNCAEAQSLGVYCFGVDLSVPVEFVPQEGRHAFVTATLFDGSVGLATFDEACATEATGAGLEGSYLALVATSTQSALSRFDTSGPPWVNALGVPLANTAAALSVLAHLEAPPSLTAVGEPVTGDYWVGSALPTTVGTSTCTDWTGEGSGRVYDTEYTSDWFNDTTTSCTGLRRVLCFEE